MGQRLTAYRRWARVLTAKLELQGTDWLRAGSAWLASSSTHLPSQIRQRVFASSWLAECAGTDTSVLVTITSHPPFWPGDICRNITTCLNLLVPRDWFGAMLTKLALLLDWVVVQVFSCR